MFIKSSLTAFLLVAAAHAAGVRQASANGIVESCLNEATAVQVEAQQHPSPAQPCNDACKCKTCGCQYEKGGMRSGGESSKLWDNQII